MSAKDLLYNQLLDKVTYEELNDTEFFERLEELVDWAFEAGVNSVSYDSFKSFKEYKAQAEADEIKFEYEEHTPIIYKEVAEEMMRKLWVEACRKEYGRCYKEIAYREAMANKAHDKVQKLSKDLRDRDDTIIQKEIEIDALTRHVNSYADKLQTAEMRIDNLESQINE